ncbi:response regulator [Candidatus Nitrosopumilus sp. SW]|uniref:TackOD1 domain-containing metal-binding protein n=1 Tax=Candidatus Nitrosopumilus sp. SW TaxID=2508726 RepID=UPI00115250BD|nr:response regulator [Candidatus Nitrosopumilus sp. SW]QDI88134.1 response regulator [Candidatus Nitrosopumilus sp. SW]
MVNKDVVLIVEDSPAIGMLLKNYLEKLGYTQIHTCDNGSTAISTFTELVSQGKQPIVLLDFMLPDMDARSILTQMLEVKPDVRVILETATEKDDAGIKELIRLGVYQYLEKPIRFENLQSIFQTIEKEQDFFLKESEQQQIQKQEEKNQEQKFNEQIDFILKSTPQITLNKIAGIIDTDVDSVSKYLQQLENNGKITRTEDKKEIACNQCDSVRTSQIFYCPSCKSSNFKLGKLIEHYDCGNITEESTYEDDHCPNCKKEIKALGVDYRVMKNHYICNNCKEFFPEISVEYLCLKCENKFALEDARWKSSINYKVTSM